MKKFISCLIIGIMLSITIVYAATSITATTYSFPGYVKGALYKDIVNPVVITGGRNAI